MATSRTVAVKRLPEILSQAQSLEILRELASLLEADRPCLVFDFSDVQQMDRAGVEMLLHCMEEAMKRNGDLKLSAVSPAVAIILELTRVDRLFEIFERTADAVESFHRFPVDAFRTRSVEGSAENTPSNGARIRR